ncbi:hypothetical protein BH23CHL2_BH23CHL2_18460 [soil metagenome]
MVDGYQPLASYGAQAGRLVEEARFQPGVNDDDLIRAGRLGAQYIRPADGFHSLVYLHDGHRHRVLAFWQDQDSIQRFHSGKRVELLEREIASWPESPWITHLEGFRTGAALRQLMGPRMPGVN